MVNPLVEKIIFHNILQHPEYLDVVSARFFNGTIIKKILPSVKEFYEKYRQVPTAAQAQEIVRLKNLDITPDQIDTAWDVKLEEYDDDWLKDHTEAFIEYKNLDLSVVDLVEYIKSTPVNIDNIREVVQASKGIILNRNNLDFKFEEGSDFFDASAHRQPVHNTFSSGYDFIDKAAGGGFAAGTLTVILGQLKSGKSIWLANLAAKAVMSGHNVAIISLEMSESKYIMRVGANMLNVKMNDYKNAANDREFIKGRLKMVSANGGLTLPGQLVIKEFPTSTASSIDIESYLKRVEERRGIKFKVVIIDYLNIMRNWRNPNSENTYMKIKQIAEDVRAMAQNNQWAILSVTQIKQSQFDSSDMTTSAAAESSALGATVDLMMGIIQDPLMYANRKYKLKVLACRDSEMKNSAKMFDVDYSHMRVTEDSSAIIENSGEE